MKQKLIMLKGLPASGKSTFAKEFIKTHKDYIRINNDDLRASLYGREFDKRDESMLTTIRNDMIYSCLDNGYSVIIDNINLNPIHEKVYRGIVDEFDGEVEFEIKEFPTDVETCILRDKNRPSSVGENVIRKMSKQYGYSPKRQPKFDPIPKNTSLTKAIIVDIDGTLANMSPERNPYDYSKVKMDSVNNDIAELAKIMGQYYNVLIVSGRSEDCMQDTIDWLVENNISYSELFMRKSGDMRPDDIIKHEIYKDCIAPRYNVEYVFDDRNRVVNMWRDVGLRCLQVADGNF